MPPLSKPPERNNYFIGIDPGENGSASVVDRWGKPYTVPLPGGLSFGWHIRFSKCSEADMADWFLALAALAKFNRVTAALEKVRSSPQMGVASAFTFGWNYGVVRGFLFTAKIGFEEPIPQTWQKHLGIPKRAATE